MHRAKAQGYVERQVGMFDSCLEKTRNLQVSIFRYIMLINLVVDHRVHPRLTNIRSATVFKSASGKVLYLAKGFTALSMREHRVL